jgi:hypothetical protein
MVQKVVADIQLRATEREKVEDRAHWPLLYLKGGEGGGELMEGCGGEGRGGGGEGGLPVDVDVGGGTVSVMNA